MPGVMEFLAQGSTSAVMVAAMGWAIYHIFKAIRDNKTSAVTNVETVAKSALDSLNAERDRNNQLWSDLQAQSERFNELQRKFNELQRRVNELERENDRLRRSDGLNG